MKSAHGWVQGYNAQAAVCADTQVVLACLVSQNANDVELYQPMVAASAPRGAEAGVALPVALFLADAGYWSEANATADGPDRLIATLKDWKQRAAARQAGTTTGEPPEDASRWRRWSTGHAQSKARRPTRCARTPSSPSSPSTRTPGAGAASAVAGSPRRTASGR